MKRRVRTYLMWTLSVLGVLLVLGAVGAFVVLRSIVTPPVQDYTEGKGAIAVATSSEETNGRTAPYDTEPAQGEAQAEDAHPLLNETQERTLERVGIDPRSLPHTVTLEQRTCVEQALGSTRMQEILAGDPPGITDALKARGCL